MAIIRKVLPEDNAALAVVIRSVLVELGVPKVGTAYEDPELDDMFSTYDKARNAYFVVEEDGEILGGAGIAPLAGEHPSICELQKMYFSPATRGLGLGKQMMDSCLAFAKENNYSLCYLETLPYMKAAQKLYRKTGFDYIEGPLGNTGHTSCNVWLTKSLL
jgi:putative acetyltransferase